ncbi:hypothetical protein [Oceanicaulis sp.]|uniref:hypothetical protein n=1 Tax=Oceanicaulis sp. TaxID=1924941 RepID=UPI003D27192E
MSFTPETGYTLVFEMTAPEPWPFASRQLIGHQTVITTDNQTDRIAMYGHSDGRLEFVAPTASGPLLGFTAPVEFIGLGYTRAAISIKPDGTYSVFMGGQNVNPKANDDTNTIKVPCKAKALNPDAKTVEELPAEPERDPNPFSGCLAKLNRAKKHIADFDAFERDFIKSKPYEVVKKPNDDGKTCDHILTVRQHLPVEMALLIGDAIHNLRAALDIMLCEAFRIRGRSTREVRFPFCSEESEFSKIADRRDVGREPDIKRFIEGIKPYWGGNDALRGLHQLDIQDKHLLIIPVCTVVMTPSLVLDFQKLQATMPAGRDVRADHGATLASKVPIEHEVNYQDTILPHVAFDDAVKAFAGRQVSEVLDELLNLSADIIDRFQRECFPT